MLSLVSTEIGDDLWRVYHTGIYSGDSGSALPSLSAVSSGYGFGHLWEEKSTVKLRPNGAL